MYRKSIVSFVHVVCWSSRRHGYRAQQLSHLTCKRGSQLVTILLDGHKFELRKSGSTKSSLWGCTAFKSRA
jgi:hypothetical protein